MEKFYIKPEVIILNVNYKTSIIETSSIPIVDDGNDGYFDSKEMTFEDEESFDDIFDQVNLDF